MGGAVPPLATTVIGSYSVPEWLERLKTDYYQHRLSRAHLDEIHDIAVKAAIKDQERVGIDVVSDGELRRDNDIDYLLARIPGVRIVDDRKAFYYDYFDAEVVEPLPGLDTAALGLVDDFTFARTQTDRPIKFSFTGPFSLSKRLRDKCYGDQGELTLALAAVLNAEAKELAQAGAALLQIDEPFLAGYPDAVDLAVDAVNTVVADVDADWTLHVCYGNRYARPSWEGHYAFLFPAVQRANVDRLALEFARKGYDDLDLLRQHGWERGLGLGVIDVKTEEIETPEVVSARIRRALEVVPPDRLVVNPDCGLRHLPAPVTRAKLRSMVAGVAEVKRELGIGAVRASSR